MQVEPNGQEPTPSPISNEAGAQGTPAAPEPVVPPEADPVASPAPNTDDPAPADPPADGAPAEPSYEFTPPEGREYDQAFIGNYGDTAKALGLSKEQAEGLLAKIGPILEQSTVDKIALVREQWAEDARKDPEFGGEKFEENAAKALSVVQKHTSPEFVEFLKTTGLANHPDMVRTFYRLHAKLGEDSTFVGGGPASVEVSPSRAMYPSMYDKKD
jgi:hypothetical protein